jgi:hypothetical protein
MGEEKMAEAIAEAKRLGDNVQFMPLGALNGMI